MARSRFLPRLIAGLLGALAPETSAARVVVVGVDGGSWNLVDPAIAAGELPNLRALAERGVTGNLAEVKPLSSPAVWTSLATGRSPEAHGITHFYSTRLDIRVPTVWERLARRGLRVGLYDYLVTWPPQALPGGFAIPGWLRRDASVFPGDVFERAGLEPYAYSLDGVRTHEAILANCRKELSEKPRRFVRLLRAHDLDVAAVTFYSVDAASHRFWDDDFPEDFEEGLAKPDPRYDGVIGEMLRGIDAALGEIVASLGADDSILVASDHGFHANPKGLERVWVTDVKGWIARTDLDPERDGFEISTGFAFVIFRVLPGPFGDREATLNRLTEAVGSARSPAGDPLYRVELLDVADRPIEARRPLLSRIRQLGLRLYLWWLGVRFDTPAHAYLFGVPRGDVLDPLWPNGSVRVGAKTLPIADLLQADDFSGGHAPTGIFLAAGPSLRRLPGRVELSVLDVSSLLFYLAGQPIPDDVEGELPEALIDPARLAASPPRTVAAAEMPGLAEEEGERGIEKAGDEEIRERLRTLGYAR
jgi:hypothetical protein